MTPLSHQEIQAPAWLQHDLDAELERWRAERRVAKLWARDATLWTGSSESRWMGWLTAPDDRAHEPAVNALSVWVRGSKFRHALLMGVGGSSLCPDVLANVFGHRENFPEMLLLDSTDPAQVRRFEAAIDPSQTLFIVSSKSGTTLEPTVFYDLFFDRASRAVGRREAATRFVAITDRESELDRLAAREGFGHVFEGAPSIGGRYSALSVFGLVPAAIMGIDVGELLTRAQRMSRASAPEIIPEGNPGLILPN